MATRGFEVLEDFKKYFDAEEMRKESLDPAQPPARKTEKAAGYDICSIEEFSLMPGESRVVSTGITTYMQDDEVLYIYVRSGLAFNYDVTLQNAVGVIDADYYGNEIKVKVRNESSTPVSVGFGERIAQGVFAKFLAADDDALTAKEVRVKGLGSTGKK